MYLCIILSIAHDGLRAVYAGMAELADAPDLGSGGNPVQVQVLLPAPNLIFEDAMSFSLDSSYAKVKYDGLWGFIDGEGNWLIEPQFQSIGR